MSEIFLCFFCPTRSRIWGKRIEPNFFFRVVSWTTRNKTVWLDGFRPKSRSRGTKKSEKHYSSPIRLRASRISDCGTPYCERRCERGLATCGCRWMLNPIMRTLESGRAQHRANHASQNPGLVFFRLCGYSTRECDPVRAPWEAFDHTRESLCSLTMFAKTCSQHRSQRF